jgi:hypothetical protein
VAIYYGYWSLRLQQWSALNDFKSQCQQAEVENPPLFKQPTTFDCMDIGSLTLSTEKQHFDSRMHRGAYASTYAPACDDKLCSRKQHISFPLLFLQAQEALVAASITNHWFTNFRLGACLALNHLTRSSTSSSTLVSQ